MLFQVFFSTLRIYANIHYVVGVSSGLEISMSNLSLLTLSVAFHTMAKSSAPAFVLLFALLFGLEKFKWRLVFNVFGSSLLNDVRVNTSLMF